MAIYNIFIQATETWYNSNSKADLDSSQHSLNKEAPGMKTTCWFFLLLPLAVFFALGLAACGGSDDGNPGSDYCVDDEDCGQGYRCNDEHECERITYPGSQGDPDAADHGPYPPGGDGNGSRDDAQQADGDRDRVKPPSDRDDGGDLDEDEASAPDGDADHYCDENTPDPRCTFVSEIYCRDNTLAETVKECRGNELYTCEQIYDCHWPTCGHNVHMRYEKVCIEGCVANPDPTKDDYCKEDGPPVDGDGDEEAVLEFETEEEWNPELNCHTAGCPCRNDDDCLVPEGHACLLDWDDKGKYCAPSRRDHCVDHYELGADEAAEIFLHGYTRCHGDTHKRCSSGAWRYAETCPGDECEGYIFKKAQSCEDGTGCVPDPREEGPCPDGYMCLEDGKYCRWDCVSSQHCAPGYICINDHVCVENVKMMNDE